MTDGVTPRRAVAFVVQLRMLAAARVGGAAKQLGSKQSVWSKILINGA